MNAFLAAGAMAAFSAALISSVVTPAPRRHEPGAYYALQTEHRDDKTHVSHWARRGDGWMAHTGSPDSRELISGTGTVILVSDPVKARSTFDRVSRGLSPFGTPESKCALRTDGQPVMGRPLSETNVAGQRVIVFQEARNPRWRLTQWVAPDLGCLVVQAVVETRAELGGPWHLAGYVTTDQMDNDTYPDWIFALPGDYREMSPSRVVGLLTNGQGGTSDALRSVDESYLANPARQRDGQPR